MTSRRNMATTKWSGCSSGTRLPGKSRRSGLQQTRALLVTPTRQTTDPKRRRVVEPTLTGGRQYAQYAQAPHTNAAEAYPAGKSRLSRFISSKAFVAFLVVCALLLVGGLSALRGMQNELAEWARYSREEGCEAGEG